MDIRGANRFTVRGCEALPVEPETAGVHSEHPLFLYSQLSSFTGLRSFGDSLYGERTRMSESLEELQRRLSEVKDMTERIDLLIETGHRLKQTDPSEALGLARQAVRFSTTKRDKERMIDALMLEGLCQKYLSDYSAAIERMQHALEVAAQAGHSHQLVRIYNALGQFYVHVGEYSKAFECLSLGLEIANSDPETDPISRILLYNSLGTFHYSSGDYPRALESYQTAEQLCNQIGDKARLLNVIGNIGNVYTDLFEYDKAAGCYARSLELASNLGDVMSIIATYSNQGHVAVGLKDPDRGLEMYAKGLELSRQIGNAQEEAYILSGMNGAYMMKQEFAKARECAEESYRILESMHHRARWHVLHCVAESEFALGNFDRSFLLAEQALSGSTEQGDHQHEAEGHRLLSQIHERLGNVGKALEHFKRHTQIQEEVMGNAQRQKIANMELRAEIDRMEKEREILRLERQQIQMEMEHKEKELAATVLRLVEKNEFLDTLKREMSGVARNADDQARTTLQTLLRQVEGNISAKEDWKAFETHFENVHQGFIERLSRHCQQLTRTELKICALLKVGMSTKEIANFMSSSGKNIEIHRYRIRKKLGLNVEQSFTSYFAEM